MIVHRRLEALLFVELCYVPCLLIWQSVVKYFSNKSMRNFFFNTVKFALNATYLEAPPAIKVTFPRS